MNQKSTLPSAVVAMHEPAVLDVDTHASFTGVPSAYCTVPVAWTANCVGVGGGVGFGGAGVGAFAIVGSGVRGGAAVGVGEGVGVTVGSGDSAGEGSVMIAPVGSGEGASSFCLGATWLRRRSASSVAWRARDAASAFPVASWCAASARRSLYSSVTYATGSDCSATNASSTAMRAAYRGVSALAFT